MKTISPTFFLLFSLHLTAQTTILGTVLNVENMPLEFASVALQDTVKKQFIDGTITEQNGQFSLQTDKSGSLQLSIQFLGYETQYFSILENTENNLGEIKLIETTNDLGVDITVTAEKPVIERKEDKLIFNIANSPLKSGYDGVEILQRAPNIFVDSDDNILMRNGAPMVMVNGRPLNMTGENLVAYIRNLQADNIKSIEIQTSSAATIDASNTGGIINIVLKKKQVGLNGNLRTSYLTPGEKLYEFRTGTNFNYGAENWNMYGSYNLVTRDMNIDILTDIFYQDTENYLRTEIDNKFIGDIHNYQIGFVAAPWKNHEIGAEFFGRTDLSSSINDSNVSLKNQADTIDFGTFDSVNDRKNSVNSSVLNYTWRFDTLQSNLKIIADYTSHRGNEINDVISVYELGELTNIQDRNDFDNETNVLAIQADLIKNFRSGFKLLAGAKMTETNRKNSLLAEDFLDGEWIFNDRSSQLNYDEIITAGYATLSKKFNKKHFVRVGLRTENTNLFRLDLLLADTITKNYTDWFPSVFYSYDLPNGGTLAANYSRRVSRPSFRDLNNIVRKVNDFRFLIGNSDLQPQYIDQYELTFQKKKHALTAYNSLVNDAINGVYFLEDGIAFYQRQNNGKQTQFGLEYSLSADLTKWLTVRPRVHLYHRKFTTEAGVDMFERTTIDLRFSSNIKIDETTGIDLSARYLSPRADAFYEAIPYYQFEFFVKKTFFDKKLECRLYLNDPFDIENTGNNRDFPEITTSLRRKMRSRNIQLWARYNFATKAKVSKRKNSSNREGRYRI